MKVQIDNQIIRFGSDCIRHNATKAFVKALLTQWAERISELEKDDSVYLPVRTFLTEEVGVQVVESLKATKKEEKITFLVVDLQGDIWDDWFTWYDAKLFSDREVSSYDAKLFSDREVYSEEVFESYRYPKLFSEYDDVRNLIDDLLQAEVI